MAFDRKKWQKEYNEKNKEKIKLWRKKDAQRQKAAGWPRHKKRAAKMSDEEKERINAKQRVENMAPEQHRKQKKAGIVTTKKIKRKEKPIKQNIGKIIKKRLKKEIKSAILQA